MVTKTESSVAVENLSVAVKLGGGAVVVLNRERRLLRGKVVVKPLPMWI